MRTRFSRNISLDQRPLPFTSPRRHGFFACALPWERRLAASLSFALVALAALYVYFVMASVVHVAAYRDLIGKVGTAKNAVSALESSYFEKSRTITEPYAESLGYVPASQKIFVARASALTLQ